MSCGLLYHSLVAPEGRYGHLNLHDFEVAAINNIGIESVDEAYELIPSLVGKVDKEDLEQLLEDFKRCQSS